MTTTGTLTASDDTFDQLALFIDGSRCDEYVVRPISPVMGMLGRALSGSLDRRLASGTAPEASRLLATRAQMLVALQSRRELAAAWLDLAEFAYRPVAGLKRAPLCRDRIVKAESEIRALATALTGPVAPAAQGVALALVLLTDGTGPLYNRHAPDDLRSRLLAATDSAHVEVDL